MPAKRNGQKIDKNETSAQTFVRLSVLRMNKAIRTLRTIPSLAYYEHSPAQTNHMVEALGQEVAKVEQALKNPKERTTETLFKF